MGGLVARFYVQSTPDHRVDRLTLIGVPNLGSFWADLVSSGDNIIGDGI